MVHLLVKVESLLRINYSSNITIENINSNFFNSFGIDKETDLFELTSATDTILVYMTHMEKVLQSIDTEVLDGIFYNNRSLNFKALNYFGTTKDSLKQTLRASSFENLQKITEPKLADLADSVIPLGQTNESRLIVCIATAINRKGLQHKKLASRLSVLALQSI